MLQFGSATRGTLRLVNALWQFGRKTGPFVLIGALITLALSLVASLFGGRFL